MTAKDWVGLIPAAGEGLRLALPYPKELYPVIRENRYKPVSQFVIDNLVQAGIGHIVFVINETKHQLIGFFGNGRRFHCDISYVVQDRASRNGASTSPGLAGALDAAYHLTRGKTVFFGMADTIMMPTDVFSRSYGAAGGEDDVILTLFETDRPEKFGMVRMDGDGRVEAIVDKPSSTELKDMWGCIIWRPRFTELLHQCVQDGISDFAAILNKGIDAGLKVRGVKVADGTYLDLGTYDEIAEMDRRFREI